MKVEFNASVETIRNINFAITNMINNMCVDKTLAKEHELTLIELLNISTMLRLIGEETHDKYCAKCGGENFLSKDEEGVNMDQAMQNGYEIAEAIIGDEL